MVSHEAILATGSTSASGTRPADLAATSSRKPMMNHGARWRGDGGRASLALARRRPDSSDSASTTGPGIAELPQMELPQAINIAMRRGRPNSLPRP